MIENREQYPRPDMVRRKWMDLNGEWSFCFDDKDVGEKEHWFMEMRTDVKIQVPFCYQCQVSGVEDKSYHEILWYEKKVVLPEVLTESCLLHFGAADYETEVWVNGCYVGGHRGGNCAFVFDISAYAMGGKENQITVRCRDTRESVQPRGKQFWGEKGKGIWYTAISGIWKNVWLEFTGAVYLRRLFLTPDIDHDCVAAELELNYLDPKKEYCVEFVISYEGKFIKRCKISIPHRNSRLTLNIPEEGYADEIQYWSPEHPWLYELDVFIEEDGVKKDEVNSYFGMRKISVRGRQILLNNKPYVQRLVLDQGYWKETLLTPPNTDALKMDILLAKEMGFNGARKHQKVEDARYYYLADKLGFLVWGEQPSAYQFCMREMENLIEEWKEMILELYNHPSIILWVPLNESWGVRNIVTDHSQQMFASCLYHMAKALDPIRLISNNDGWEQIEDSDICGIHDYTAEGKRLTKTFEDFDSCVKGCAENRLLYGENQFYKEKPVLLTEFGGIAFKSEDKENWGYYGTVNGEEEFFERFGGIVKAAASLNGFAGFCYTQLTDVFQETNGLLNFDRSSKVDKTKIREIVKS